MKSGNGLDAREGQVYRYVPVVSSDRNAFWCVFAWHDCIHGLGQFSLRCFGSAVSQLAWFSIVVVASTYCYFVPFYSNIKSS
jgi:hypothetical protein